MLSPRSALFAAVVLSAVLISARSQAEEEAAARFQIAQRAVTAAEFEAFRAKLKGQHDYHCKKTTFGGVTSYLAQDPRGKWYRVTQVSGGTRPSRIEPSEAPSSR
jgi:hypothetical protein